MVNKKKLGKIAVIGGLGVAALFALAKFSEGNEGGGGMLGGTDDLEQPITDSPFSQSGYDSPEDSFPQSTDSNNYFFIEPDGTIVSGITDPETGEIYKAGSGGIETYDASGNIPYGDSGYGAAGGADPYTPKWYETGLGQFGILAGGIVAGEYGASKLRKMGSPKTNKLFKKAGVRGVKSKINPMDSVRKKLGFSNSAYNPHEEIMRAKTLSDADVSVSKSTSGKGGKMKGKLGKAGKIGVKGLGTALFAGQIIGRTAGAFNEYGKSYLSYTPEGKLKKRSIPVSAFITGQVASVNIVKDFWDFGTGLVYRPKKDYISKGERDEGELTGWFATPKDILNLGRQAMTQPGAVLSGLTGYGELKRAITVDKAAEKPGMLPATSPINLMPDNVFGRSGGVALVKGMGVGSTQPLVTEAPAGLTPAQRSKLPLGKEYIDKSGRKMRIISKTVGGKTKNVKKRSSGGGGGRRRTVKKKPSKKVYSTSARSSKVGTRIKIYSKKRSKRFG